MITIIKHRYKSSIFFGLEGKIQHPTRIYSGYTDEEIENSKRYNKLVKKYKKTLETAVPLNPDKTKKTLDNEIPDWEEKSEKELKHIKDLNSRATFNTFEDMQYKSLYTLYYLEDTSLKGLAENQ